MIPVAAGLAYSLQRQGRGACALNFIGDGGTSTGDFHEGLNLAAVWKLPLILVIENNRFAFSTPVNEQYACERLADRGPGYGIPGIVVSGTDPEEVYSKVHAAVENARNGGGPTLVEGLLGRLRGHSEQDRSLEQVPAGDLDSYRRDDPVPKYKQKLLSGEVVRAEELKQLEDSVQALLLEITDAARASPEPEAAEFLKRRAVFCAPPAELEPDGAHGPEAPEICSKDEGSSYLEAIRRALVEEMERDPQLVLMGQDIGAFGGAFRVTDGLFEKFGPHRVKNTPIAESGTIGLAIGASLLGHRPVVEMQFGDFISCGFNQVVNVAAKMYFRCRIPVPLVIRCPIGGGAGAGPFHSQCIEGWFTQTAGLKVVAPAFPDDALGLLKASIRDPNPVLYLEHKFLYRRIRARLPEGGVIVPLGRARVVRAGGDATLITYSWMVHRALEAAEVLSREGVSVEVVDLRSLIPLDEDTVLGSVRKTSKAMVIHEAPLTGGFGAEIAARIADQAFEFLDGPVRRLAYPDLPVPCHPDLEQACLPGGERLVGALRELVRY
jgi:pyruvate/2-oxoglutarate/acetoin dehydrogenase E1 component